MNRAVFACAACLASAAAAILCAAPAGAQFLAPALEKSGFDQRLRQPSLRLATLGRATLAFDDENNEINQWDFGASTVGLVTDRNGNSVDLFIDDAGTSAERTVGGVPGEVDRYDGSVYGLSAVARNGSKFAFGLSLGYQGLGAGVPLQPGFYQDEKAALREAVATFSGRMAGGKLGWGARLGFGNETYDSQTRTRGNEDGEEVLSGGDAIESPTAFDLTEATAKRSLFGLGLGWMAASWGDVAINWDNLKSSIDGSNETRKRIYEIDEPRRSNTFSLTTMLKPIDGLTFGGVVGTGGFTVDETYRYTQSNGQGAPPLVARGDRLARDVEGDFLKTRLAFTPGGMPNLLVGADFNVSYHKDAITAATTPGSFNEFLASLNGTGVNPGMPVLDESQEVRHWDAGVGVGYLIAPRLRVGAEGHRANDARDGTGVHARTRITDFRGGVEYGVSSEWQARIGGWHRALDQDVYTANNEGIGTALTLGAGYRPMNSKYSLDGGVEIMDRTTDYPDPGDGTGSGFRFVLYNRWSFN